jgi:hypothetical protein
VVAGGINAHSATSTYNGVDIAIKKLHK